MSTKKFTFSKNKYNRELLIDCFLKSESLDLEEATDPYTVNFYELIFITKGMGSFALNGKEIKFRPGTVLLLPPDQWRQWKSINKEFDAVFLIFEEEHISSFFNDPLYLYRLHYFDNSDAPNHIHLEPTSLTKLLSITAQIQHEIKNLQDDSSHLLRSLLYYLLITLNRKYSSQHGLSKSFYHETLVLKFRRLLEKHILEKQRVTEYADLMGISPSHLNKLLKNYFGKSCSEMIKHRYTLEVKKWLLFSDKSISEVCYTLGFSELSNFSRFCQKNLQMNPKEFRAQNDKF